MNNIKNPFAKRKNQVQKTFELELSENAKRNLWYFIKQELAYFNHVVENLTPWLRTFPQELLNIKGNEKRLWNAAAEYELDFKKLYATPLDAWPTEIASQRDTLWSLLCDEQKNLKVSPRQLELLKIVSAPAKLPRLVRNLMASELLRHMQSQAEILDAALKTDTMRSPIQMLQVHTLESKRHLQIPSSVVFKIAYDEKQKINEIYLPYCKETLIVADSDISKIAYKTLVIKAPHPQDRSGKWLAEFKDTAGYAVNLTDHDDRRRRK